MSRVKPATILPESQFPRCLRCDKRVDRLIVSVSPNNPRRVVVEFECHGEHVSQEMPARLLEGKEGLAPYTAFNEYTSRLLLKKKAGPARIKKGNRK